MTGRLVLSLLLLLALSAVGACSGGGGGGPPAASLSRPGTIADTWRWDAGASRGTLYGGSSGPAAGTRPAF